MKKILVIRVGRAGDIVMITPALQAILQKYSDASIDVLTSVEGKRVLSGFDPRLHVQYIYQRKSLTEFFQRQKIVKQIASQHYDIVYCFDLNPSFRDFYKQTGAEINQIRYDKGVMNYAHYCLELVRGDLEIDSEHEWIWLPVTEAGREKTRTMLAEQGIDDDTLVIGLHPSFSGLRKSWLRSLVHREEKAWPESYFGELALSLCKYAEQQQLKLAIIMDLMPEDRELGEAIVSASQGRVKLFIPPLDFQRYKATLERMYILVVPNTGPMHLAGAVGTNLVALFGDISAEDSGAYVPSTQRQFICAPSGVGSGRGLSSILPEQVYQACLHFLQGKQ